MQITVEISEEFAARAANLGLTPEAYAREVLTAEITADATWEAEALRRAGEIDSGQATPIPWEQIESRLRSRVSR
jgi:putative addiction module component (TIGR02574 family)